MHSSGYGQKTKKETSGERKKELDQQAYIASGSIETTTGKKKEAYLSKHINWTSLELHLKTRSAPQIAMLSSTLIFAGALAYVHTSKRTRQKLF